jgi:uncharacterized protein YceK
MKVRRNLNMKFVVLMILAAYVAGCGTIKTTALDKPRIEIGTKSKKSLCSSIPHIYSGIFYNICWLHRETNPNHASRRISGDIPLVAVDTVLSGLLDTILLPYSIYKQAEVGSIKVDR